MPLFILGSYAVLLLLEPDFGSTVVVAMVSAGAVVLMLRGC